LREAFHAFRGQELVDLGVERSDHRLQRAGWSHDAPPRADLGQRFGFAAAYDLQHLEQARHAEVDMFADQIVERGRADTCISLMPAAPALHSDSPPVSALHRTVQRIKAEMVAWRSHLRADVP
jgi:hypothetical protein